MSGKARHDQVRIIEEQQQQLQRYEKRLRDVVTAYKGLLKEKAALEVSLRALGDFGPGGGASTKKLLDASPDPVKAEGSNAEVDRVATLAQALATLTEEKLRIEASFKAEKKQLKKEHDDMSSQLHTASQDWSKAKADFKGQLKDLRNKLRVQQMDHEKEQTNHAVMLRELQTLVAAERGAKEHLETQLEEMQKSMDKKSPVQQKCEEYQCKMHKLSEELEAVRDRLKVAEEKATQPQPLLLKLQQQMDNTKAHHDAAILQERSRANNAEERLRHIAKVSEERVAGLEAKLSELSETVGSYDRVRHQDQRAIQRLKERVSQLDLENIALARAAGTKPAMDEDHNEFTNLDVQTLVSKIIHLKGLLHLANQRSENPMDVNAFLQELELPMDNDHSSCQKELAQLKAEFEGYKIHAQSLVKNGTMKGGGKNDGTSKGAESLRLQVVELCTRVRALTKDLDEQDILHRVAMQEVEKELSKIKLQSSRELVKLDAEYRERVSGLESQMQKQRERTLSLLAEKDDEARLLKASLGFFGPAACGIGSAGNDGLADDASDGSELVPLPEVLSAVGRSESRLLHYIQEIARRDQEVASLRRERHRLDVELRRIQQSAASEVDSHAEEVVRLHNEIQRLTRNRSRDGANLEYLKNVVYSYVTTSDTNHRCHMLNAIATLLEFSPQELRAVQHHNRTWWWQQTPKKSDNGF